MRPRAEFPCDLTYVKLITPPHYVGWDGMVYVDPVQLQNRLSVIPADGSAPCQAQFSLTKTQGIQSIGPIVCQ